MNHSRRILLLAFWMVLTSPVYAQIAGFAGADDDRDGLPDDFEQAVLEKFRPNWNISATDCDGLPAEFRPNVSIPTVKEKNGTIYGQVFRRGSGSLGFFVEAHFYDLWGADCGYINSHTFDVEHVSVLIRALESSQPLSEWHASQWYASAHEDTVCDASQFASASIVSSEDLGGTFWIARGKHGAFFSQQTCSIGGCGLDRCDTSTVALSPVPVNIGELNAPLNGAVWTASNRWTMASKMRTDFPTFSSYSSLAYSFPDRGGVSYSTTGSPQTTVLGYTSIQSLAGTTAPSGMSIFGYRRNNVLVTEAGVPASPLINSGRIYAEVGSGANTGLAIVNPGNQPAEISFYFTNSNGQNFGTNKTTIAPKAMLGKFLNELPYNSAPFGSGTFTFTSTALVSVVALRTFTNERGEFLITSLPISSLSATAGQLAFPHVADGGGWTTQFVLVNPTDDTLTGTIEFFAQGTTSTPADPLELTVNGQTGSTLYYAISPRSYWVRKTAGVSAGTRVGWARVTPSDSGSPPSGVVMFSFKRNGTIVTETGIAATPSGAAFRLFSESTGNFNAAEPGSIQTGIAIANLSTTAAPLLLELTTLAGTPVGASSGVTVPANGQVAMFLNQLPEFAALPPQFQGILRISTQSGAIAVIGLRGHYNERRDFLLATTAATNETANNPAGDTIFPYLAEGGGYTTQFILSSPPGGPSFSGWLRFYSQTGVPLNLSLK